MKFAHLSDLHLGRHLHGFPLLEDQKKILEKILEIIDEEKVRAIVVAGDVYDKSSPAAEAMTVFDEFLGAIARRGLAALILSGNHDSDERLAYLSGFAKNSNIHISPVFRGIIEPVVIEDEFGPVNFFMIPFIRPHQARKAHPGLAMESWTEALGAVIGSLGINPSLRNVAVAHQFVTGAATCDSEEGPVGGLDNVDASIFAPFDYVALGHIHGPQSIGAERIRYCGSPLKYSVSEAGHKKSLTIVNLGQKGELEITLRPLKAEHDLRVARGLFEDLAAMEKSLDYMHVILEDEYDVPDAIAKLREPFPRLISLAYDNSRTRSEAGVGYDPENESKTPLELFYELYCLQNNAEMSREQFEFVKKLMDEIWGESS